jgi:hypothetical protein
MVWISDDSENKDTRGRPLSKVEPAGLRFGKAWVVGRNLLLLCLGLLILRSCGAVGMVKDLTFSKRTLKTPNPTSYVFHAPAAQIRKALPQCTDTPCPPAPTPCLVLNRPTDGTNYDLVQLDRTESEVYQWFGVPLLYKADYAVTVTPEPDSQTRVDIRASEPSVLLETGVGVHGGDFLERVEPTTIEEYRILMNIGRQVGEKGMPQLQLPQ